MAHVPAGSDLSAVSAAADLEPARTAMSDLRHDIADAGLRATPPVIAFSAGLTLNEWVAIATLIYIILQAVVLIRREFFRRKPR